MGAGYNSQLLQVQFSLTPFIVGATTVLFEGRTTTILATALNSDERALSGIFTTATMLMDCTHLAPKELE